MNAKQKSVFFFIILTVVLLSVSAFLHEKNMVYWFVCILGLASSFFAFILSTMNVVENKKRESEKES